MYNLGVRQCNVEAADFIDGRNTKITRNNLIFIRRDNPYLVCPALAKSKLSTQRGLEKYNIKIVLSGVFCQSP